MIGLQFERRRHAFREVVEIAARAELLEQRLIKLAAVTLGIHFEDHEFDAVLLPVERRANGDFGRLGVELDLAVGRLRFDDAPRSAPRAQFRRPSDRRR